MPRLKRVDCSEPGIRRIRRGRGFSYVDEGGGAVSDEEVLTRIRELVIPPAWKDVWICIEPNGHLQATGVDDAGRKQYLYHERWRIHRDREKFDRMVEFAAAMPRVRRRVRKDLKLRGLVRDRVLGCGVRLLDLGMFRVGSEQYAEENETYGLATIRRKHLHLENGMAVFDFVAKNSQPYRREIRNPEVLPTLKKLKEIPGAGELLTYREKRAWVDVRSTDINDYLKQVAGGDFSAKDFRTWNATVAAAVILASFKTDGSTAAAKRRDVSKAVKQVAGYLGNTPAVCRASYIDPRVIDHFESGDTIDPNLIRSAKDLDPVSLRNRQKVETAVLELLA